MTSKEFKVRRDYWYNQLRLMMMHSNSTVPVFTATVIYMDLRKEHRVALDHLQLDGYVRSALINRYDDNAFGADKKFFLCFYKSLSHYQMLAFWEHLSNEFHDFVKSLGIFKPDEL